MSIFSFGKNRQTTRQISSFYPISGKGGVGGTGGGSIKHHLNGGMFGGGGPDLSFNKSEYRNEIKKFNLIQGGDLGGGGGGGTAGGGTGHGK